MAQLEQLAARKADWAFRGALPLESGAPEVARKLVPEFGQLPPSALSSEPETGAVSFQWAKQRVFVFIEDTRTVSMHCYVGENLEERTINVLAFKKELTRWLNSR